MPQSIHLDSSIFIPQLYDRDPGSKDRCEEIYSDVRGAVRAHDVNVKISKLVVGEVFSRFYEDYWSDSYNMSSRYHVDTPNSNLTQRFEGLLSDLDAEFVDVTDEYRSLQSNLLRDGSRLGMHDRLISATAVADRDCTHLLAIDSDIWTDPAIEEIARTRYDNGERNHRLTVSDSYD